MFKALLFAAKGAFGCWKVAPRSARVTILDGPKFKEINFAAPKSVNHVCKLDILPIPFELPY